MGRTAEVIEGVEVIEERQRRSLDHLDTLDDLDYRCRSASEPTQNLIDRVENLPNHAEEPGEVEQTHDGAEEVA